MSVSCSACYSYTQHAIFSSPEGDIRKVSKILTSGTSLSWFSCNINLSASLDRFSGRHLFRFIKIN